MYQKYLTYKRNLIGINNIPGPVASPEYACFLTQ